MMPDALPLVRLAALELTFFYVLVFGSPLEHRDQYAKRLFAVCLLEAALLFLGLAVIDERLTLFQTRPWLIAPVRVLFFYLFLRFLIRDKRTSLLYVLVWGVMGSNFLLVLWDILFAAMKERTALPDSAWFLGVMPLLGLSLPVSRYLAQAMPEDGHYSIGPRQLSSAIVLLTVSEALTGILLPEYNHLSPGANREMILLLLLFLLLILYLQHSMFRGSALQKEINTLNLLREQQKEQYELSRENIELINRKCHDLKHQIRALRAEASGEKRDAYLDEIADSIRIYESVVKTGNDVLDTLLTEKSLLCRARGIEISCVADGGKLTFMDPVDLYTVFGNALDNAIEEVSRFEDRERRRIDVVIYAKGKLLQIEITNPRATALTFEDGIPKTTKGDNGYHGFGLKSIRRTVESYGGWISVDTSDGCFALRILLPVK